MKITNRVYIGWFVLLFAMFVVACKEDPVIVRESPAPIDTTEDDIDIPTPTPTINTGMPVDEKVIYKSYNVSTQLLSGQSVIENNFDINSDGTADFKLKIELQSFLLAISHFVYYSITPQNYAAISYIANTTIPSVASNYPYLVKSVPTWLVVESSLFHAPANYEYLVGITEWNGASVVSNQGLSGVGTFYVATKHVYKGGTRYGWLRMSINPATKNITVLDGAHRTGSNASILVGQSAPSL